MNLLVDPILLTLPESTADEDHILSFVHSLCTWNNEVRKGTHQFWTAENYVEALQASNRYPTYKALSDLWAQSDINTIGVQDAFRACRSLIEGNIYRFDDLTLPDTIAVYEDQVRVDPNLVARLPEAVATAFRETLGYVVYARERNHPAMVEDLVLVTHPHPIHADNKIQIDAPIETNQGQDQLETDIPLAATPTDLLGMVALQTFWDDTPKALAWAMEELVRARRLPAPVALRPYGVAQAFNESIRRYGFDSRPDLLTHIFWESASLLTGLTSRRSTNEHHLLRDVTCNNVDQTGRTWNAWRLWVTRGKPTLRLHYWWCDGEYILSRVVPHNDYEIGPVR